MSRFEWDGDDGEGMPWELWQATLSRALGGRRGQAALAETADAGRVAGLRYSVAWHLAYLNDEEFASATPEKRYELMLAWVRRAQGKPAGEGASS